MSTPGSSARGHGSPDAGVVGVLRLELDADSKRAGGVRRCGHGVPLDRSWVVAGSAVGAFSGLPVRGVGASTAGSVGADRRDRLSADPVGGRCGVGGPRKVTADSQSTHMSSSLPSSRGRQAGIMVISEPDPSTDELRPPPTAPCTDRPSRVADASSHSAWAVSQPPSPGHERPISQRAVRCDEPRAPQRARHRRRRHPPTYGGRARRRESLKGWRSDCRPAGRLSSGDRAGR